MPKPSAATRRQAVLLILFIVACAAFLAWRLRPRDRVEQLLSYLPERGSVQLYVDVPRAGSALPLDSEWFLGLTVSGLDAAALAFDQGEVHAALAGVPAGLVEPALARQGAECEAPLTEQPCALELNGRSVRFRQEASGTLLAATDTTDVTRRDASADAAAAREAIEAGAMAWAALTPAKLLQEPQAFQGTWSTPLLAVRAVESAETAYLTLEESPDGYTLRLSARCAPGEAEEAVQVLRGLNQMGATVLQAQGAESEVWRSLLGSFEAEAQADTVEAAWTLSGAEFQALLREF